MKQAAKTPPPDSILNLQGRQAQLHTQAHVRAMGGVTIVVSEDGDRKNDKPYVPTPVTPQEYEQRLAKELKDLAPAFKTLEQRLRQCGNSSVAAQILKSNAGEGEMPLSREKALTQGLTTPKTPDKSTASALLDFMQSTLDS